MRRGLDCLIKSGLRSLGVVAEGLLERPRSTRAEDAFAVLRDDIVTGALRPGTPLRLEELARQLEMSHMPIREAIRRLEGLGLAEHVPHRGARVSELSVQDLHDTYEARIALESVAVGRAADRFTEDHAHTAEAYLREHLAAYEAGDVRRGRAAHGAFHFTLYEAADSRWLVRLIRPLWENSERYRIASLHGRTRRSIEERAVEHRRILSACRRRQPRAAARELHQHLALTANLVARQMGESDLF
jgi:DNA-binding GntR family transcriptional regulator